MVIMNGSKKPPAAGTRYPRRCESLPQISSTKVASKQHKVATPTGVKGSSAHHRHESSATKIKAETEQSCGPVKPVSPGVLRLAKENQEQDIPKLKTSQLCTKSPAMSLETTTKNKMPVSSEKSTIAHPKSSIPNKLAQEGWPKLDVTGTTVTPKQTNDSMGPALDHKSLVSKYSIPVRTASVQFSPTNVTDADTQAANQTRAPSRIASYRGGTLQALSQNNQTSAETSNVKKNGISTQSDEQESAPRPESAEKNRPLSMQSFHSPPRVGVPVKLLQVRSGQPREIGPPLRRSPKSALPHHRPDALATASDPARTLQMASSKTEPEKPSARRGIPANSISEVASERNVSSDCVTDPNESPEKEVSPEIYLQSPSVNGWHRTCRLSSRPDSGNFGPILRVAFDADAVLLGIDASSGTSKLSTARSPSPRFNSTVKDGSALPLPRGERSASRQSDSTRSMISQKQASLSAATSRPIGKVSQTLKETTANAQRSAEYRLANGSTFKQAGAESMEPTLTKKEKMESISNVHAFHDDKENVHRQNAAHPADGSGPLVFTRLATLVGTQRGEQSKTDADITNGNTLKSSGIINDSASPSTFSTCVASLIATTGHPGTPPGTVHEVTTPTKLSASAPARRLGVRSASVSVTPVGNVLRRRSPSKTRKAMSNIKSMFSSSKRPNSQSGENDCNKTPQYEKIYDHQSTSEAPSDRLTVASQSSNAERGRRQRPVSLFGDRPVAIRRDSASRLQTAPRGEELEKNVTEPRTPRGPLKGIVTTDKSLPPPPTLSKATNAESAAEEINEYARQIIAKVRTQPDSTEKGCALSFASVLMNTVHLALIAERNMLQAQQAAIDARASYEISQKGMQTVMRSLQDPETLTFLTKMKEVEAQHEATVEGSLMSTTSFNGRDNITGKSYQT